jgi:hypothetical protein
MYIAGIAIFIFGLAFFLRNLGVISFPGSFWSLFWPLVVIGFGIGLICLTHAGRQLIKKLKEAFSRMGK